MNIKILNNDGLQKFAQKHKDSNFPMHIFALKDIFTTELPLKLGKNYMKTWRGYNILDLIFCDTSNKPKNFEKNLKKFTKK